MGTNIFDSILIVAIIAAIPGTLLAYLTYKRGRKGDAIVEQAGIATVQQGTISQVIDGLNKHANNLQADNMTLRKELLELRREIRALRKELKSLEVKLTNLT